MALEAIKLKDKQELRSINLEPATNGGAIIRYTIYTPAMKNSESIWDERSEVFSEDEIEDKAMPRIVELYKVSLASKKSSVPNKAVLRG